MKVAIIGSGTTLDQRREAVQTAETVDVVLSLDSAASYGISDLESAILASASGADLLFLCVEPAIDQWLASAAVRHGINVFLAGGVLSGIDECRKLASLADEAGVAIGVSRPMRFLEPIRSLPDESRYDLVHINAHSSVLRPQVAVEWLDLSGRLAGSRGIQRLDAQATHKAGRELASVGVAARFQNGALALLHIVEGPDQCVVQVANADGCHTLEVVVSADGWTQAVNDETLAFVTALAKRTTPPYSLRDAIQSMRRSEQLMQRLRQHAVVSV